MNHPLFRSEVFAEQANKGIGKVNLVTPVSFKWFLVFALTTSFMLIAYSYLGTYTRKARISGQLVPETGLIKLNAIQSGTVLSRHVAEGDFVQQGQLLFTIGLDRGSARHGNTQEAIADQLEQRRRSLITDIEKQRQIADQEESALRNRLLAMRAEAEQITAEIENQQGRMQLAEQTVKTFDELTLAKFASPIQAQQKREELMDQKARLKALERSKTALGRDIGTAEYDLRVFPLKARQQREALERQASVLEQEIAENEARREITILATQDGQVTNIMAQQGQFVTAGSQMLAIVPSAALLEAHLYAPSRAVGFVRPGDQVLLRYQAFPYQKFGQHAGVVRVISRSAQNPQDYAYLVGLTDPNEPLYRITVSLEKQQVLAYGQSEKLQPGMVVDADVLLDRRRIYEWILDPLYSVLGKV